MEEQRKNNSIQEDSLSGSLFLPSQCFLLGGDDVGDVVDLLPAPVAADVGSALDLLESLLDLHTRLGMVVGFAGIGSHNHW